MTPEPVMKRIKVVALDVNAMLTEGGSWWVPDGEEWMRFCFADVIGISLARKAGLVVALISGENNPVIDRFARKLGTTDVGKSCKDKASAALTVGARYGIDLAQMCFQGDDLNDMAALELCGFSAAPADAPPVILAGLDSFADPAADTAPCAN